MCIKRQIFIFFAIFLVVSCADLNKIKQNDFVYFGVEEYTNQLGQPVHVYCRECMGPTKKTPVYQLRDIKKSIPDQVKVSNNTDKKQITDTDTLGATLTPAVDANKPAPITDYKQGRSFGSAFFEVNSSELSDSARTVLDEVVTFYKSHPNLAIRVSGYTDLTGPQPLNRALANKRANSVIQYLNLNGIEKRRISNLSNIKVSETRIAERRADTRQGGEIIFVEFDQHSNQLSESAIRSLDQFVSSRSDTTHYWLRGVIDGEGRFSQDNDALDHKSVDLSWAVRMHLVARGVSRERIRILRRQPDRLGWRVDVESLGETHPFILAKI